MMNNFINLISEADDFINVLSKNICIDDLENRLGFKLADEYIEYIIKYGVASANGHEFTGGIESKRLNVIEATNRFWKKADFDKQELYVVEEIGVDGVVILQDSKGVVYQASCHLLPIKIYDSLAEYYLSDL